MFKKDINFSEGSPFLEADAVIKDILDGVEEKSIQYQTREWCDRKAERIYEVTFGNLYFETYFMDPFKQALIGRLWLRWHGGHNRAELEEMVLENLCFEEMEKNLKSGVLESITG